MVARSLREEKEEDDIGAKKGKKKKIGILILGYFVGRGGSEKEGKAAPSGGYCRKARSFAEFRSINGL